jgi:hypothetical protein
MAGDAAGKGNAASGADCESPACAVKGDMFSMMKKVAKDNGQGPGGDAAGAGAAPRVGTPDQADASSSSLASSSSAASAALCPLDKEDLGQSTWALVRPARTTTCYPTSNSVLCVANVLDTMKPTCVGAETRPI